MKKKYFAPKIEEVEMDEPVVLSEQTTSGTTEGGCATNQACAGDY